MKNHTLTELKKEEMIAIDGGVRWGEKTFLEKVVDFITSLF